MGQPGKVANPARGPLNRGNQYPPVPVGALNFGLGRRVQPSHPAWRIKRMRWRNKQTYGEVTGSSSGDSLTNITTASGKERSKVSWSISKETGHK